jgi:hypothetical protein
LKTKYPVVDCQEYFSYYNNSTDDENWLRKAGREFQYNRYLSDNKKPTNYQGSMQCLCDYRQQEIKDGTRNGTLNLDVPAINNETGKFDDEAETVNMAVCEVYL